MISSLPLPGGPLQKMESIFLCFQLLMKIIIIIIFYKLNLSLRELCFIFQETEVFLSVFFYVTKISTIFIAKRTEGQRKK